MPPILGEGGDCARDGLGDHRQRPAPRIDGVHLGLQAWIVLELGSPRISHKVAHWPSVTAEMKICFPSSV